PGAPPSHYPLAAPPMRLRVDRWNFGTASPGREMSHRFKITNSGAEPWQFKHVTPSCSCAVGQLPSKNVKPGETVWLEVTYRAPLRDGRVAGPVRVDWPEPGGRVSQLMIEGKVRGLLSAAPSSLVLDYPAPATRLGRTVTLRNHADRRVVITRVET